MTIFSFAKKPCRDRCKLSSSAIKFLNVMLLAVLLVSCGGSLRNRDAQPPTAVITPLSSLSGAAPFSIQLSAESSSDPENSPLSFTWSLGDGVTVEGPVISYLYSDAGDYTVVLTATNESGASATAQVQVNVRESNGEPVADLFASTVLNVAPFEVEFNASGSTDSNGSIVAYRWDFGDGQTGSGPMPSHTYQSAGTYDVTLQVEDNDGLTDSATKQIVAVSPNARFTVEGRIDSLPYTDVDGDVNDPYADYFDNTGGASSNIQAISNPVMLNGYASSLPTGSPGDAFSNSADLHDVYGVDLVAGQFVSMHVINFNSCNLDLYLMKASDSSLVASSTGTGEFESMQAPADGRYWVLVHADDTDMSRQGGSKYLLKVGNDSYATGLAKYGQSADFGLNEAVVKLRPQASVQAGITKSLASRAQMKLSHSSRNRASLASFNELNPQTQNTLQMREPKGFEQFLAANNPETYAKIQTLRAIRALKEDDEVEYAEPNYRMQAMYTPNDPFYRYQWHYDAMNLPQAWDITQGDPSVVVAVLDTGVYLAHEDFNGQLTEGYDFISDLETALDGNGLDGNPDDPGDGTYIGNSSWHGTHVAGTIAAATNNRRGGAGIAPDVRLMPLRVLGKGGGSSYDIMQAVRYAAGLDNDSGRLPAQRADILNLSLGGLGYSQYAQNLFREVRNRGVIVVAASGNENTNQPLYPASYSGVVSVAAVDFEGRRAPYSNYGEYVDIAAPGGNVSVDLSGDGYGDGVLSHIVSESRTGNRQSDYAFYHGTSMAAPHVAGVIALMKSVYPDLTPDEFDSLLVSGELTVDAGPAGRDDFHGYGNLDALRAVQAAQELAGGASTSAIIVEPSNLYIDFESNLGLLNTRALGEAPMSITQYQSSVSWLQIAPRQVDANGIGSYEVLVDRSGLSDGIYPAEITFSTAEQTLVVNVTVRVGEPTETGDAGYLYILLIDAVTSYSVAMETSAGIDGQYHFRFDDVPVGEYFIAAGSDVDNDGLICEDGESCGFYPSFGEVDVLTVYQNKSGINFSAGLFDSVTASTTSLGESHSIESQINRDGIFRLPQSNP